MNFGKENELLEFKLTTKELDDSLIDISAILNKHGEGVLYFGVKNDGDLIGFQIGDSTERDISRRIYEKIKPQIFPTIESNTELGYIKVTFSGKEKPYSANGRYYIRVSDESREMTPFELSQMIMDINYKKWERQISDTTIDDIDENNLKIFLDKAIKCERLPKIDYDKVILLDKLSLLYDDKTHLNNAGKYLFSNKGPIQLKMAVFATNEKRTFIDISPINGNIFELMQEAEKYIKKHINWAVEINGFERIEIPEIPIDALREIINNSFAHANYLSLSKNEIDIFPNRIAIYNPGSFPDNITPEDYVNETLSSKIRNEIICDVLYKCRAIETWGTGFKKAYTLCNEAHVKCYYEKEIDGFWFIMSRSNVTTNVIINGTIKLTELEQIVLNEIKTDPYITREKMEKKYGRSSRTFQRVLDGLKEKRIIERVGSHKTGYWKVLE